jgi:hypothetical protein
LFLLVVLGIAFYFQKQTTSPLLPFPSSPSPTLSPIPTQFPGFYTFGFEGMSGSSIRGTATIRELSGLATISLSLTGVPANMRPPVHIREGSCSNIGLVKYPLVNPQSGKSDTTLEISLSQLKSQAPLSIVVLKSPQEPKVFTSCTTLSF